MGTIKQTILIVEDDEGLLELISEKIESCGYQTALVQSAGKAIDWLKVHTPFLMILDYGLPDMNGKEIIAELEAKEILVPPFMVCTGQGDERIAVDMMKLGARDYIIKDSLFLEMIPLVVGWVAKMIENESKLKLTGLALIESAQFNKQIIESVQEGVIVYDRDLKYQVWNPFMENLSGLPASEVIGKYPIDLFPFLTGSCVIENLEKTILEKSISEIELQFNFPITGKSGWVSDTIAPLVNTFGEVIGVITTLRDITERKQTEEALRDSEHRYRLLVETANEGILVAQDGYIKFFNPMMQEITGFSEKELLTLPFIEYVFPEDRELVMANYIKRIKGGLDIPKYQLRIIRRDGKTRWIELNGSRIEWEGQPATLNMLTDITERKKAEEKIIMLAQAIKNCADCIAITDKDYKIIFANDSFCKVYGFENEDVVGQPITVITSKNNLPEVDHSLYSAMTRKEMWMGEVLNKRKDGNDFPVLLSLAPVITNNGELIAIVGVLRDITERKLAEEEIRLKNEQLLKLNAEKDKFFSIIAHDLRGPFSGFLGLTEIMAGDIQRLTMEEIQDYSATMRNSATHLYRLLENLLQWSRIQQGSIPFKPELLQLLHVVEECMATETAKNKEITIEYDIPDYIEVYADNNMLQTVIRNMVSNAVKFTPKGGKISVSAKVLIDSKVEISIKDTGIGMSQAMIDNLFRPDVQTSRKGTEGEPSSGLGLLLCKEFIEKHGGRIWVESEVGKGSEFKITLPDGK